MPRDPTRDVVRGLTSLEMTFVNVSSLRWTLHSGFVGQITYADTIFPCFAFLSGMSPAPARRNVGIIGIGLGLHTVAAAANGRSTIRIPGVLQRLGVASLIANEPHLAFLRRYHGVPLVLLWYAITLFGASKTGIDNPLAHPDYPAADALEIAQTRIDRFLFGQGLYRPSYDPEGLLGSLTTAVSMLIGRSFESQNLDLSQKLVASIGMITVGEAAHLLIPKYAPISKSLWTPSFVLVSSGISILKYLALDAVIPYLPTAIQNLLQAVGKRSLEVYAISTLLTLLLKLGGEQSFMARGMRWIGIVTGPAGADFIISLGLSGIVAASAQFMVAQNLRLAW
jgi:predicted acyltransferase